METKSNKLKEEMFSWLLDEIGIAESEGLPVQVDGRCYSSQDAEHLHMVMEDCYYMKSYISDEQGHITRIDFDHIGEV